MKTEDTFRIWDLGLRIWKDMEHDAEGTELICYLFLLRAPCSMPTLLVSSLLLLAATALGGTPRSGPCVYSGVFPPSPVGRDIR